MSSIEAEKEAEKKAESLDYKKLIPVLVIVMVDVLGITIIIPVLPFYALAFDASPLVIGMLGSSYPVMQFVFAPILGSLSDRYGRKPVLATAQVGTFLSLLVMGFAGSLWMLFFSRIIDGITGANLSTAQAVITDSTPPEERAKGLGLIGAIFGVGFVLGPVISGVVLALTNNNYGAPALVAASFALLSVFLTTFVLPETNTPEMRTQTSIRDRLNVKKMATAFAHPTLGILFTFVLLLQLVFGSFQLTFAPFTLNRLGLNSVGNTIFFAMFGIILAVVQGGLVGPMTKRFGERRLILIGIVLVAAGFFLAGLTPQQAVPWYSEQALIDELGRQTSVAAIAANEQLALLPPDTNKGWFSLIFLLLGLLPLPVGIGLILPNINSLITKRAEPDKIGEALGLASSFTALGTAVGPLYGGWLFETVGPNPLYLINGALAGLLFWLMVRRLQTSDYRRQTPS